MFMDPTTSVVPNRGRFSQAPAGHKFDLDISSSYYLLPPQGKSADNDETELSIFDAHKYFSENAPSCPEQVSASVASVDGGNRRNNGSASSEASWNSQTRLLANQPASSRKDGKKGGHHGNKTWIFGRKCCCAGEKSVIVKEITLDGGGKVEVVAGAEIYDTNGRSTEKRRVNKLHIETNTTVNPVVRQLQQDFPVSQVPLHPQQRVLPSRRGFSFPVPDKSSKPHSMLMKKNIVEDDDLARDSIEVFQPPALNIGVGHPCQHFKPASPIKRLVNTDDDVGSDASSDLFEIESFSTSIPTYRRQQSFEEKTRKVASGPNHYGRSSLDEPHTPSIAATECYPPSEVSVVWSVTTAEGRASLSNISASASDVGEEAFSRRRVQVEMAERRTAASGGGGLLLMNCRQEKAVSVGPQPVKFVGPPNFPLQMDGRPPRSDKPPHSARLSLAYAA